MKLLILIIFFTLSPLALAGNSFDYHGIKSGMTEDEVNKIIGCTEKCTTMEDDELKNFFGESKPPLLSGIVFAYTSDKKLWRIQLKFMSAKLGSNAAHAAQTRALEELYPDAELKRETENNKYFSLEYVYAMMIDNALFNADVEKIYQESISKY